MFKRYPYLFLVVALAIVSLSATSAMATDEVPAPPPPPAAATPPPATGGLGTCTDKSRPSAKISTSSKSAGSKRSVRGTASDPVGCGASGKGSVAHVAVSVTRKSGKKCRNMSSKGRLGKAKSCSKPTWLSARGDSKWSFGLPKKLGSGAFTIRVQAVDSAGNVGQQRTLHVKI